MGANDEARRLHQELQETVDRLLAGKDPLRVLEAGCGSMSYLRFPASARVTGIDLSQRQLDRNQSLHERIVGDVQTYDLPAESFDAVICWNVLEHLTDPDSAVRRFARALRPEGVLILACPNPHSFKGLGARLTPHWFHVLFYKTVLGFEGAGADDVGPFPTVMSSHIAPKAICRLAASCGLAVEMRSVSRGTLWLRRGFIVQQAIEWTLQGLAFVLRVCTLGKYRGELAETRLVFRKIGSESAV